MRAVKEENSPNYNLKQLEGTSVGDVFMVFSISVLFPYFTPAKFGFILPSGCRED
jgi:hypothetical protein